MKVILHGFRCHDHLECEFEPNQIHLLDGPSGSGKSTVLQAIAWCLYGGLRSTSNHRTPKAKMWVRLHIQDLTIYRQRNPGLLQLTVPGGVTIEDRPAQAQINRRFGNQKLFNITSYIEQNHLNGLLEASSNGRLDILNRIAFDVQDPKVYIDRISSNIRNTSTELRILQDRFSRENENFKLYIQRNNVHGNELRSSEQLKVSRERILKLQEEIQQIRKDINQTHHLIGRRTAVTSQIERLEKDLKSIPAWNDDLIDTASQKADRYQRFRHLHQEINSLSSRLSRYGFTTEPPRYTSEDLSAAITATQRYTAERSRCVQLHYRYDRKFINEQITKMELEIKYYSAFEVIDTNKRLRDELQRLETLYTEKVTDEDILKLRTQLSDMERSKDVVPCPNCSHGLRIHGRSLYKATENPFDPALYQQLQSRLGPLQTQLRYGKRIEQIRKLLNEHPDPEIPQGVNRIRSLAQTSSMLEAAKRIQIVELPEVDADKIQKSREWWIFQDKLEALRVQVKELGECQPVDLKLVEQHRSHRQRYQIISQQLSRVKAELDQIECPSLSLEVLTKQLNESETSIRSLNHEIQRANITQKAIDMRDALLKQEEQVNDVQRYYEDLCNLKDRAVRVECTMLQTVVDSINSYVDQAAQQLFDEPISIKLSLYRQLKTTSVIKPEVVFELHYKGGVFTDIKSLSGGERERLNLIFTVALNRVSGSNFLILDESLVSLDIETRDACNDFIRSECSNITVLIVSHEGCKGLYDSSVKFSSK